MNDVTSPHGVVVAVANQKGGVGKSTTTVNLAAALVAKGERVLVVDTDPQSNATSGLALDPVRLRFNHILIDCPPSLGLITVNALTAADEVLIPIQAEYYALEGLTQLLRSIQAIQTNLNPQLKIEGAVITMYDRRTTLAAEVTAQVRDHFGAMAYTTVIPRVVRLAEAPSFGEPIESFDPKSIGAKAYRSLADEFRRRHGRA